MVESFLPHRKSQKTSNRFGFIRYANSSDVNVAISKANGLWVGNRSLIVERASFDRKIGMSNSKNLVVNDIGSSNHRDYGKNFPKPVQKSQFGKAPHCSINYPTLDGPSGSIKHSERTLNVQPTASEWLSRSSVVQLFDITSTEMVQKAFIKNKFSNVVVKFLGGLDMIITFNSKEDRKLALNNQLIKGWFKSFRPWSGQAAGTSRLVDWINIHLPTKETNNGHDANVHGRMLTPLSKVGDPVKLNEKGKDQVNELQQKSGENLDYDPTVVQDMAAEGVGADNMENGRTSLANVLINGENGDKKEENQEVAGSTNVRSPSKFNLVEDEDQEVDETFVGNTYEVGGLGPGQLIMGDQEIGQNQFNAKEIEAADSNLGGPVIEKSDQKKLSAREKRAK
ncbi:hypothetical protein Vadar_027404 [Vaccinium darrowii]|uniref:Uncharacterized protein n=1 Tax=Vaccinium darrowii TaxID=229202 RepID=A0ACB7Y3P2_9ERIC|nr:hypothetical protein Vadar_027404 [Vaccinium darrowii]